MAYDASNNQQDQNQVVSSTPLTGGQQPAAQPQGQDSQASQAPSQPSTVQSGMSSTQAGAAQQPQQSNKPASSGMFTNIQKYVQKNKPQAQKMAGAVTENVGSQASDIAAQAEKKQADMKAALDSNQASLANQRQEAENIVGGVMGTNQPAPQQPAQQEQPAPQQEQPAAPQQDPSARFQELMQGPQGMIDVGNVSLAEQSQKAKALQQMAGQAGTEQGRRNLLQDTFSKQGEYTQGMGGLDQLITSGDDQARQQITQGVQDEANALSENISDMSQQFTANVGQFQRERDTFGDQVRNLATAQMESDQFGNLDDNYARLRQLESDFAQNQTMDKDYEKLISGSQGNFDRAKAELLNRIKAEMRAADTRMGAGKYSAPIHKAGWKTLGDQFKADSANLQNPEALLALEKKYMNPFGDKTHFSSDRNHQQILAKKAWDQMLKQQEQQEAYNTSKGLLSNEISGLLPQTQENLSRFQKLKGLLGQEDVRSLSGLEDLELAPSTVPTRTGGSGGGRGLK